MNSTIASNIIGNPSLNQKVASGSCSSVLVSHIEFVVTDKKSSYIASNNHDKYLWKLGGKESADTVNGTNKIRNNFDQNKNLIANPYVLLNGNKEKVVDEGIPTPKVQLYSGKIHMEWKQIYKIGAGLNNLGNTCFMNTVIQCLTYCPPLANYLLHESDHATKCSIAGFCMMCVMQKHMRRAIGKTGQVIKPIDVYQKLRSIAKHFQFGRQEDAHEFLRYVIDNLWKSCLANYNGSSKLDPASKETTVINQIFGGYHRSQVTCLKCKGKSNTFDHFMDFMLDIKQNVLSLEKALEKFTRPELLQLENAYRCPKCKMKVSAQKKFSVYQAPTVATLQLKRFDYHGAFGGKITKQVQYPEKLNLRPYMSDTRGDPVLYRLNAVLVHSGSSCNSGHYYCYVKNSNGYWYLMDDQRVHQVSINQVLSESAYVLFYIRLESTKASLDGNSTKKCIENKSVLNITSSNITSISDPICERTPMKNGQIKIVEVECENSQQSTSSSSSSSVEYEWVEKTKETIEKDIKVSSQEKPKDFIKIKTSSLNQSLRNGDKESLVSEVNKKSKFFYGTPEKPKDFIKAKPTVPNQSLKNGDKGNVVSELNKNSKFFYGAPVESWTGEKHVVEPTSFNSQKNYFDDYDDDIDRGKVRKHKSNYRFHKIFKENPFQRFQNNKSFSHSKFHDKPRHNDYGHRSYNPYHKWKPHWNDSYSNNRRHYNSYSNR